jgi:8-oxo-dGTP pyrophosphatase MutT (NUDIX family)
MVLVMSSAVAPYPAATVVVVRSGVRGPEVYMVRRHDAAAFMGGAHVFPGGRVDAADREIADAAWCDGIDWASSQLTPLPSADRIAHHVAAARELFEEAGVLLARDRSGHFVTTTTGAGEAEDVRFKRHRHDVHAGRHTLRDVVVAEGIRLALDSLIVCGHWVTPPLDTRRFDTWFFLTRMPAGQATAYDEIEHTHGRWMTPSDALDLARRGELVLPIPTWSVLRELAPFESVDDIVGHVTKQRIVRREPRAMAENGDRLFVLPGDPLYPESGEEPMPFETRFIWRDGRWQAVLEENKR